MPGHPPRSHAAAAANAAMPSDRKKRGVAKGQGQRCSRGKGGGKGERSERAKVVQEGGQNFEHTGPLTTVIIRNIPQTCSRDSLTGLLDSMGLVGYYDFVYMPLDFHSSLSFGYAFVNFVANENAKWFMDNLVQVKWQLPDAQTAMEVEWSWPSQGLQQHVDRYRNSPVMHPQMEDKFKPIILQNGVRTDFPPPTKFIPHPPRMRIRDHKLGPNAVEKVAEPESPLASEHSTESLLSTVEHSGQSFFAALSPSDEEIIPSNYCSDNPFKNESLFDASFFSKVKESSQAPIGWSVAKTQSAPPLHGLATLLEKGAPDWLAFAKLGRSEFPQIPGQISDLWATSDVSPVRPPPGLSEPTSVNMAEASEPTSPGSSKVKIMTDGQNMPARLVYMQDPSSSHMWATAPVPAG
mmetsp:Transcript_96599/g.207231  ORF Transcript_96599/g.207231 Transcript_96599/m.207231 type:complete len:408 (-) Transcript_96599:45-1268(-)